MPSAAVRAAEPTPPARLAYLMDGFQTTQLLYVAAKLGVADALAAVPRSSSQVAQAVGAEPGALYRVLRGLAAEGVLDELPDGQFGLTPLGTCLRGDVPGSLRGQIIARGDLYYRAAAGLLDAVQRGGVAFEAAYGSSFFEYLAQHPERAAEFQHSMTNRSRQEAADVVAAYDFGGFDRVVDVGGGAGILLTAILAATSRPRGVLLDRPGVVERASEHLRAAGLASRCEVVAGDFFAVVPAGGDLYLLSRVIHDWDDEAALRILRGCHRAMAEGGKLLLVEAVLPARAVEQPTAIRMDLHMLTLLSGQERTEVEYRRLLQASGFELTRVVPTASPAGISILEACWRAAPAGG